MWLFNNAQEQNLSYDGVSTDGERQGRLRDLSNHASRPASALFRSHLKNGNRSIIAGGGVASPMSTSGGAMWS